MTAPRRDGPADSASFETPDGYIAWPAASKAAWMWDNLIQATAHTPVSRPDLTMTKPWPMASVALLPKVLARTFSRSDDVMEATRPKIIHTQGTVALIELATYDDSPFSGILGPPMTGGAVGLLRLSLAIPPKAKKSVTPGIGIKFFVDGAASLDVLAMNHTVGQGRDINLFSNSFTHDLRHEHGELRTPQKLMAALFKRVVPEPRHLTIDHLAAVTRNGSPLAQPLVPERLVFRPHGDVLRVFKGHHDEDYRVTVGRVEAGTSLYYVDAVGAGPAGADLTIGEIRLTKSFVSSDGGDRLFFKHSTTPENLIRN